MSAASVLQAAAVAALAARAELTGMSVFDAPPVRAALPYAVVDDPVLADWSGTAIAGREGRLVVTLVDAGERPVRLRTLADAAEAAVRGIGPGLADGWRIASLSLVRSRVARGGGDRWIATGEFRVRVYREVSPA